MVIEVVSGERYREYVESHLFGPLGLTGSFHCEELAIIPRRARGYVFAGERLLNAPHLSMNHPGAGGALCSTVLDLLSWSSALHGGRVVPHARLHEMTAPMTLTDGSSTGYGFGVAMRRMEGHDVIEHGGGIPGFNSWMSHYPETELDVVVLSNTGGNHPRDIAQLIAGWAIGVPTAEPD